MITKETVACLNDLLVALHGVPMTPLSNARWRRIVAQGDVRVFILKDGKKLIGTATLRWHELPDGEVAELDKVVVSEDYRGRGLGEMLVKEVLLWAQKRKIVYIDLTSRPERIAANKLYQKLGWKKRETNVYRFKG